MLQAIDPSVADEARSRSRSCPSSTCTPRRTAGVRGPSRRSYDRDWLAAYRDAQSRRVARIDAHAQASNSTTATRARDDAAGRANAGSDAWRHWRKRAVHLEYMTIYRTLADPAYLDPTIDPDDRPLGSLFAFPDPFDANYGRGGLARTMTSRGLAVDVVGPVVAGQARRRRCRDVTVPTLVVHATADTEIRRRSGPCDRRRGRQRRRHVRRDRRARRTTSKAIART